MKVSELSELLGVDDKHVYRMAARGRLPSFHVGLLSVSILKKLRTGFARNTEQQVASTRGRHVALHRKQGETFVCRMSVNLKVEASFKQPLDEGRWSSCKTAEVRPVERKDVGDPMGVH